MGTLTVDLFSSLDGYAATERWPGYWGLEGPELFDWLHRLLEVDHTMVMGATTYRTMSRIVAEEEDPSFARLAELPKVVFSSTMSEPLSRANTRVVAGDAVTVVRAMKKESVIPMRTIGSLSLGRTLLAAGLVDRFRADLLGDHGCHQPGPDSQRPARPRPKARRLSHAGRPRAGARVRPDVALSPPGEAATFSLGHLGWRRRRAQHRRAPSPTERPRQSAATDQGALRRRSTGPRTEGAHAAGST
jgi:dihydrofolate reductase